MLDHNNSIAIIQLKRYYYYTQRFSNAGVLSYYYASRVISHSLLQQALLLMRSVYVICLFIYLFSS